MSKKDGKLPHYTGKLYNVNDINRWFRVLVDSMDGTFNNTYVPYMCEHITVKQAKNIKKALYDIIDQINDQILIVSEEDYLA